MISDGGGGGRFRAVVVVVQLVAGLATVVCMPMYLAMRHGYGGDPGRVEGDRYYLNLRRGGRLEVSRGQYWRLKIVGRVAFVSAPVFALALAAGGAGERRRLAVRQGGGGGGGSGSGGGRDAGEGDVAGGDDQYVGRPIGRVLTKMGKVSREQVVHALNEQKSRGGLLGEVMVRLGYVTPADVEAALAAQRGEAPPNQAET